MKTGFPIELPKEILKELQPNVDVVLDIPKNYVLVTTTMYPSKDGKMAPDVELRANLALETARKARDLGFRIVVVDGGSDASFSNELADLGAIVEKQNVDKYPGEHDMGRSRRQAMDIAGNQTGYKGIIWLEPEKHTFIKGLPENFAPRLYSEPDFSEASLAASRVYDGSAQIVVPRRLDTLASYPLQQQPGELFQNFTVMNAIQHVLRQRGVANPEEKAPYLDWCIGPRVISNDVLDRFLNYRGTVTARDKEGTPTVIEDRWALLFAPVWDAILEGVAVRGVPVNYIHPPEQTELESSSFAYDQKRCTQVEAMNKLVMGWVDEKLRKAA